MSMQRASAADATSTASDAAPPSAPVPSVAPALCAQASLCASVAAATPAACSGGGRETSRAAASSLGGGREVIARVSEMRTKRSVGADEKSLSSHLASSKTAAVAALASKAAVPAETAGGPAPKETRPEPLRPRPPSPAAPPGPAITTEPLAAPLLPQPSSTLKSAHMPPASSALKAASRRDCRARACCSCRLPGAGEDEAGDVDRGGGAALLCREGASARANAVVPERAAAGVVPGRAAATVAAPPPLEPVSLA